MLYAWFETARRWVNNGVETTRRSLSDGFEVARRWVQELDMTALKRELRNVNEADSLGTILVSSALILGAIGILVLWATRSAYL